MDFNQMKMELLERLDKNPSDEDLSNELAILDIETGDFESALDRLIRNAEANPSVQSLNNLGYFYFYDGDFINGEWVSGDDNAIALLERAISLEPESHFPYALLGLVYMEKEYFDEAERVLRKAADIKGSTANYNNLGAACYKQEKYEEAREYFQKAHEAGQGEEDYTFRPYLNLGVALARLGRIEEAQDIADSLLHSGAVKDRGSVDIADIAELYYFLADYERVIELFPAILDEYIISPDEFTMYAVSLTNLNMPDKAREFLDRVIEYNNEFIRDISSNEGEDDENREQQIASLKDEIEEFKALYERITGGEMPPMVYEPRLEEECYLFGCIRHNSPEHKYH